MTVFLCKDESGVFGVIENFFWADLANKPQVPNNPFRNKKGQLILICGTDLPSLLFLFCDIRLRLYILPFFPPLFFNTLNAFHSKNFPRFLTNRAFFFIVLYIRSCWLISNNNELQKNGNNFLKSCSFFIALLEQVISNSIETFLITT